MFLLRLVCVCVCVWLTREGKKILENLSLCSYVSSGFVFLLKIILDLSSSNFFFLILILLCVGMVELGLCWYMWIDFFFFLDNLVYVYT